MYTVFLDAGAGTVFFDLFFLRAFVRPHRYTFAMMSFVSKLRSGRDSWSFALFILNVTPSPVFFASWYLALPFCSCLLQISVFPWFPQVPLATPETCGT